MSGFKNKVEGTVDQVIGEAKEQYGKLTNKKRKVLEGKVDKAKGTAKKDIGAMKDRLEQEEE